MTAPDTRPRFRQAVHVDDLSNPKRPRIETRHRESIIAPGKRIEASDRDYYVSPDGSLRRAHTHLQGVSRRSRAKPATKAQQKGAARIEAAIAKREGKPERRRRQADHRRSVAAHAAAVIATPDEVIRIFRKFLQESPEGETPTSVECSRCGGVRVFREDLPRCPCHDAEVP